MISTPDIGTTFKTNSVNFSNEMHPKSLKSSCFFSPTSRSIDKNDKKKEEKTEQIKKPVKNPFIMEMARTVAGLDIVMSSMHLSCKTIEL